MLRKMVKERKKQRQGVQCNVTADLLAFRHGHFHFHYPGPSPITLPGTEEMGKEERKKEERQRQEELVEVK